MDKKERIEIIGALWRFLDIPDDFVKNGMKTAFQYKSVYDLMELWIGEDNEEERNRIINDIKDMIAECDKKEIFKMKLDKDLRFSIAKALSKHFPYSAVEIDFELEAYKSVDIVLEGLKCSLEYNISLPRACFESISPFKEFSNEI